MAVNTSPISLILQSFQRGVDERQREEDRRYQRAADLEDRELRQKQIDQQIKSDTERLNIAKKNAELTQALNAFKMKSDVRAGVRKGEIPVNFPERDLGLPEFIQKEARPQVNVDGVSLSPDEYVLPDEYYATSPDIRLKKDLQSNQYLNQLALENLRQSETNKRTQATIEGRAKEGELNRANRLAAAGIRSAAGESKKSEKETRLDRKEVNSIIKEHNIDAITKLMPQVSSDLSLLNKFAKEPRKMSGADDVALAYIFARNMDRRSTVREGEVETISKYSTSLAEKLGVDLKRIASGAARFSPQQRMAIMRTLEPSMSQIQDVYNNYRSGISSRIKEISPDYDVETGMPNPLGASKKSSENKETDKVRVINPKGEAGYIPRNQLKNALSQGYKEAK